MQITRNTIDTTKGPGDWADFYKKFTNTGGYVFMSAVGFDADPTRESVPLNVSPG